MERPQAFKGLLVTIEYAVCLNGSCPGLDFYCAQSSRDQAKLNKLFQWLGDHGWIKNDQKFKRIEGTEFLEFKSHQLRMPCVKLGSLVLITHGFRKKNDQMDPQEILRARRIVGEDSSRFQKKGPPFSC